jgi:hypothetical protein
MQAPSPSTKSRSMKYVPGRARGEVGGDMGANGRVEAGIEGGSEGGEEPSWRRR